MPTDRTAAVPLPRVDPEVVGVDAGGISSFVRAAVRDDLELHSLMLSCRGSVVAEGWWWPYGPERRHMLHSATKSFLSAAVGLAIADRAFRLDDTVVSLLPNEVPDDAAPGSDKMTVRDLLTMSPGHDPGISMALWRGIRTSLVTEFFRTPLRHEPGSHFAYSSAPSYLLSAVVQSTTGQTTRDYLNRRLLRRLGIDDLRWDRDDHGINPGGRGAWTTTEDLLRLGLLHLQGGEWQGEQLLPRWWVRQATAAQVPTSGAPIMGGPHPDSEQGYGFHFWRGRHNTYRAFGLFGQYVIVMPDRDAVLALSGALTFRQQHEVLDLVWEHVLPALSGRAAPSDPGRPSIPLGDLRLPDPVGDPVRDVVPTGRTGRWVCVAEPGEDGIDRIVLEVTPSRCVVEIDDRRGRHRVECGVGRWHEGDTSVSGHGLHHAYELDSWRVLARAWWDSDSTLVMTWRFIETAFADTVTLRFVADRMTLDRSSNVNSGATERPTVSGTVAESEANWGPVDTSSGERAARRETNWPPPRK